MIQLFKDRLRGYFGRGARIRRSFAQHGLDLKLLPYLDYRRGFFIEAGANDGITYSNSLYFEKYLGWKGLLVEGIPDLAGKCRKNRPGCIVENCALVSFDYVGSSVEMQYNNLMSIVKGSLGSGPDEAAFLARGLKSLHGASSYSVTTPARTLSSILDQHRVGRIDLLSLDVEGYELNVLQGLDFSRYYPTCLLLEVRSDQKDELDGLLKKYYSKCTVLHSTLTYDDVLFQI